MDRFEEGYRRFRKGHWRQQRELFEQLAMEGQNPKTMVLGCCDSRVDPQRIFDVGPGEFFVARNVANLGVVLYSEHLLAVEMAGTLLLVATIGAVAIAGRRRDEKEVPA